MKSFKILSALLLALRLSPSSLLPSSHPAPTGAHVAPNRHRTTPQFSLLHQPSLCNLELQSSRFTSASLLVVAQLMTKRQTQINNTCTKAKVLAEASPEQDRQTNGQTPTLLQRHSISKKKLQGLAADAPGTSHYPLLPQASHPYSKKTHATYLRVTSGP